MNKKLYQYILIILGIIMFLAFIWFRFIRTCLPKDIPFHFSLLGFCVLVSTCSIFLYIVISLLRQSQSSNSFIKVIINIIYIPLETLDHSIKNISKVKKYYKHFIIFLIKILEFLVVKTNIFYYTFTIIPRLILLTTLFTDIFYFGKLEYIYKVLILAVFILLGKYIIYSLKYAKTAFIQSLESYVSIIMNMQVKWLSLMMKISLIQW